MKSISQTLLSLVIVTLALLIMSPSTTTAQTVKDGFMLSTRSRSEVLQKIVHHLVNKTGNRPSTQKYHDGKEVPNIVFYEALFSTKERHITVQYFPGKKGESLQSVTFFVTERNPANRWSISVNMDGALSSATGDKKTMVLSVGAGKEHLDYWCLKGDPMIRSILTWQEKK